MRQIPNEIFFGWAEEELAHGRPVQFRLKGNSMFPLLRNDKDEVILHPCQSDELLPMDVVLFRYRGKHLLHRIIRREGSHLLLQGDGSYVDTEECTTDDVIGKVEAIVRPSGKIVSVDSRQWRWTSSLWRKTGILRKPLLRLLHIFS